MAVLKWFLVAVLKLPLLLTVPIASLVVPLFYRAQADDLDLYTWGGQYGTFDNPPQGDRGFISKHASSLTLLQAGVGMLIVFNG